ncbi:MAG: release factor H-coupled RctB family protein [Myxococcota bacterium]|jgi:release factor H-coupled RctB family protein
MTTLPENASLLSTPEVWMEGAALEQLARVAGFPGCRQAVGMPDLHPGPGIPIGAAFDFAGTIRPHLVGSDAGCGVLVVAVPKLKASGDALHRRILATADDDPLDGVDRAALVAAVWEKGPAALAEAAGVPASLADLAERFSEDPAWLANIESAPPEDLSLFASALGSIGGGNHFLELSRVSSVTDRDAAAAAGLRKGGYAVIAHSGSRGLGRALIDRWGMAVLRDEAEQGRYLAELAGAVRFARANRLVLCWTLLHAAGVAKASKIGGGFDVIHNTVVPWAAGGWLHRKGSAPAGAGEPTIVLGSRGAESWVMAGAGAKACLCSVAHGAGRKMGRGEAVDKLKVRYRRSELTRTSLGGRVICANPSLLYAEHPDAYKAIGPVVDALEVAGAARRVAALSPMVTIKR